jgi:hypothetical protein
MKGAKTGGRSPGTPNKNAGLKRLKTQEFFEKILDDKKESVHWKKFMTGKAPDMVSWQAFKRAVEYKRGMPIQPNEHSGVGGGPIPFTYISSLERPQRQS